MDLDALMDSMRAEVMALDPPIATWRGVAMPPSGPGEVETHPGEMVVVTEAFELLLVTPSAEAIAVTRRHGEAIERAAERWDLESFTPETVAGALCAEIIQTNRRESADADPGGG
jgi:hypothetical protein